MGSQCCAPYAWPLLNSSQPLVNLNNSSMIYLDTLLLIFCSQGRIHGEETEEREILFSSRFPRQVRGEKFALLIFCCLVFFLCRTGHPGAGVHLEVMAMETGNQEEVCTETRAWPQLDRRSCHCSVWILKTACVEGHRMVKGLEGN